MPKYLGFLVVGAALLVSGCAQESAITNLAVIINTNEPQTVRVGYFPNITHAQALVGLADGNFQAALGENVTIEPTTFNAGPEEIEALFAGDLDIGYVGPSPALNGFIQSQGEALKIVAGAMSGGTALVLQPDLAAAFAAQGSEALRGKKIASPQQGSTQDISLRYYVREHALEGDAIVEPIANADQLTLFSQKQLDGSWAPEPWASRLVHEAGGVVALDESDLWPNGQFATAVVIARTEFLQEHADLVQKWVEAHEAVTAWIQSHPTQAQQLVNQQISSISGKPLDATVLAEAWDRLEPETDILDQSINTFAGRAIELNLLDPQGVDLNSIYDRSFLTSHPTQ